MARANSIRQHDFFLKRIAIASFSHRPAFRGYAVAYFNRGYFIIA
jgi:hypothetical protein